MSRFVYLDVETLTPDGHGLCMRRVTIARDTIIGARETSVMTPNGMLCERVLLTVRDHPAPEGYLLVLSLDEVMAKIEPVDASPKQEFYKTAQSLVYSSLSADALVTALKNALESAYQAGRLQS